MHIITVLRLLSITQDLAVEFSGNMFADLSSVSIFFFCVMITAFNFSCYVYFSPDLSLSFMWIEFFDGRTNIPGFLFVGTHITRWF